jgi:hypothetical protein
VGIDGYMGGTPNGFSDAIWRSCEATFPPGNCQQSASLKFWPHDIESRGHDLGALAISMSSLVFTLDPVRIGQRLDNDVVVFGRKFRLAMSSLHS